MSRATIRAALVLLAAASVAMPGRGAPAEQENRKKVSVLLAASAPTREYQFLRHLLVREMEAKRAEVCTYIQPPAGKPDAKPAITSDLSMERHLTRFPDVARDPARDKAEEKFYNLRSYDVVVLIDLDWERLKAGPLTNLRSWIKSGGGLVLVAGPVNTRQLVTETATARDKQVRELYPVELAADKGKSDRDRPWRLHFPEIKTDRRFLKLDAEAKGDLAGWSEFFTDKKDADKDAPVQRGFFNYFPAKSVKKEATVVATLADPSAKLADGKEQPFLVTMKLDKGRVVYLTSGELWRLRQYREGAYDRLWMQLLRHAAR
jgi:uncharacterized membrane protein